MMKFRYIGIVFLPLFMWACNFNIFNSNSGKGSPIDSTGIWQDRNHGAEQDNHWTGMATWAITQYNGTWADFSHLRQYEKDSLLIHEFFYYPHKSNGVDYGQLFEDSNWYDSQARLIFKKQYYGPPTYLPRYMDVHYVYRTGNNIDSIIDTLFENKEKVRAINIFKTRISRSPDGRFDSVFIRSDSFSEFMSDLIESDSTNKVLKKMSVAYDPSSGRAAQDTEYVTIKYKENTLVNKVYEVILDKSESKNDSIAYTYFKNGKMDSLYIYKSGVLYSGGKVDYRIIYDMDREIQSIYNWPTVYYKKAAGLKIKNGFMIPPCHKSF